ncbi:CPBP family intramembrane metalloprotease [Protaetiibacter sp. SSC-01]|uniref:CPBP family intramembrane glutamic endopeptidase n=1 Tax=Protaetiibacter sp. SSC-01 TaxID=2759943 RepID=UPI001656A1DB|nr:CPBP family intramembrane glutamic endopeptidase [Protaetiibacter sp. SSC-01]QNO38611.1 CPBP family intramembrane metalloprotease [Protaetiibacter sp. SSC-01]
MEPVAVARDPRALIAASGVAASALLLFGFQLPGWGHLVLVASIVFASWVDRELSVDLTLVGVGIAIVSSTSVEADVSWPSFFRIGIVLALAVAAPFVLDRFLLRRREIRFPWRSREKKTRLEIAYLFLVPFLGWLILPFYFIRSGAYANWPHITDASQLGRFFVGVNAVGTWDELFFICTVFALLRRHFPVWQANLVQAVIFVSFLWELGYRAWGPLLTFPFALLQGYLFARTRSLGYVLAVHLLFDAIVFLAIVHAHNPEWIPIFIY